MFSPLRNLKLKSKIKVFIGRNNHLDHQCACGSIIGYTGALETSFRQYEI